MVVTTKPDISLAAKQTLFLRPGSIWYLPVSYVMEFPPTVLHEDEQGIYKYSDNNAWKNPKTGNYEPGLGESEIVTKSKVRPFLVLQKPDALQHMVGFNLSKYYSKVVTGFPITRLKRIENNPTSRIDIKKLTLVNDYGFIHYISNLERGELSEKSCVILSTPVYILLDYFTTHLGFLSEKDLLQIKSKVQTLFDLT